MSINNLLGWAGCATLPLNWNPQDCATPLTYKSVATLIVPCDPTLTAAVLDALNPTLSNTVDINTAIQALPPVFALLPTSVARLDALPKQEPTEGDNVIGGYGEKPMFHPALKNRKLAVYTGAKPAPSLTPISYSTLGYNIDDLVMRINTMKKIALLGEILEDVDGDIVMRWNVVLDNAQKAIFPKFQAAGTILQVGANDNIQMYQGELSFSQVGIGGITHSGAILLDPATLTFLGLN